MPLTDDQLVKRIAQGDTQAFSTFYDRHSAVAYGLARRICRRPQVAEDAMQEAFLDLWRDAGRFEPRLGTAPGWLFAIVRHRSIDALRRVTAVERRREPAEDPFDELAAPEPLPHEQTCIREDEARLATALDGLPALQREIVVLAYFAGLTQLEISDRLGVPLGTVKSRSRLALKRLATDPDVVALAA